MKKLSGPMADAVNAFVLPTPKKPEPSMYGFKSQGTPHNCITPKQLAAYLQVSLKTLERMRKAGEGPHFIKWHNGCIRYPILSLDAWMMEQWTLSLGHKPPQLPSYIDGIHYK